MYKYCIFSMCVAVAGIGVCFAQSCAKQWTVQALSELIQETKSADTVYRVCAIRGRDLQPILKRIAKPNNSVFSAEGAAQACLAKMGDEGALDQITTELYSQKYNKNAIDKLAWISTNRSLSILMDYVIRYNNDRSKLIDMGDVVYNPVYSVIDELKRVVPKGPDIDVKKMPASAQVERWREWWAKEQNEAVFPSLENRVPSDPYSQCLARKIEWGFPDALHDLSARDTRGALVGLFRELAGPESAGVSEFHTMRGNAQAILAKRGDEVQFNKIVAELNTSQYVDAIPKLLYIGDLRSVGSLMESLDLATFLGGRNTLTKEIYDIEAKRYLKSVFEALTAIVKTPPVRRGEPPTKENIKRWKQWWKSGQTVESLSPLHNTYE